MSTHAEQRGGGGGRWLLGLVAAVAVGGCAEGPTEPPEPVVATVEVVSPIDTVMARGKTVQLVATALDAAGDPVSGVAWTWSSSVPATASVTSAGLVTGVAAGTTVVTASAGAVNGSVRMRVVVADLGAITTVLTDPLVPHLLTGVSASVGAVVDGAVDAVVVTAAPGDILEMQRQLTVARTAVTTATSANDVALLAALDLLLSFAEARLGL